MPWLDRAELRADEERSEEIAKRAIAARQKLERVSTLYLDRLLGQK